MRQVRCRIVSGVPAVGPGLAPGDLAFDVLTGTLYVYGPDGNGSTPNTFSIRPVAVGGGAGGVVGARGVRAVSGALAATRSGNVLTNSVNGDINLLALGGVGTWALGDFVLLPSQAVGVDSGQYAVSDLGTAGTPFALTRAASAQTAAGMPAGTLFVVTEGTGIGQVWANETPGAFVVNTTTLVFARVDASALTAATVAQSVASTALSAAQNQVAGFQLAGGTFWGATGNWSEVFNLEIAVAASGATGAPDDVPLPVLPAGLAIVGASILNVTESPVPLANAQVRTVAGGGGVPLCGPILIDAKGKALEGIAGGFVAMTPQVLGAALFLRRSDRAHDGVLMLTCRHI